MYTALVVSPAAAWTALRFKLRGAQTPATHAPSRRWLSLATGDWRDRGSSVVVHCGHTLWTVARGMEAVSEGEPPVVVLAQLASTDKLTVEIPSLETHKKWPSSRKVQSFFGVKIKFEFAADEHVAGASKIRTTHQSICHPCLKSNPQSSQRGNFGTRYVISYLFQGHKAPSLLSGDVVSRSILAPVFYSFQRRKYPLTSVLTNPCS